LIFLGTWGQLIKYGNKKSSGGSGTPQVRIIVENDTPPTAVVTGSKDSAEELNCDFYVTDS